MRVDMLDVLRHLPGGARLERVGPGDDVLRQDGLVTTGESTPEFGDIVRRQLCNPVNIRMNTFALKIPCVEKVLEAEMPLIPDR